MITVPQLSSRSERHAGKPSVPISQGPGCAGRWGLSRSGGWTPAPPSSRGHLLPFTAPQPCLTTAPQAPRRLIKLSVAHTLLLPLTLSDTHTPAHVNCVNLITQIDARTENNPPTLSGRGEEVRNANVSNGNRNNCITR